MSVDPNPAAPLTPPPVLGRPTFYPESDGKPMADNTRQWDLIVELVHGLRIQYADEPNVWVAGDVLWYPREHRRRLSTAPDCLVVFGRPKGHRGSYLQWREDNIAPQVVFEVLSLGGLTAEMRRKLEFYRRFGVDEYYVIAPDVGELEGWVRQNSKFARVPQMNGWVSPRLQMRFVSEPADIEAPVKFYYAKGERFTTGEALARASREHRAEAEAERLRADAEAAGRQKAEAAALAEKQRADRLAEVLRQMGVDPDAGPTQPPSP